LIVHKCSAPKRLAAIVANDEYAAAASLGAASYRRQIEMSRFVRMVNND